eukprot:Hpha_TRINITY_DN14311_c1_g2::TRINITY_DN14311_c1_g2_i3::g.86495::m.86495
MCAKRTTRGGEEECAKWGCLLTLARSFPEWDSQKKKGARERRVADSEESKEERTKVHKNRKKETVLKTKEHAFFFYPSQPLTSQFVPVCASPLPPKIRNGLVTQKKQKNVDYTQVK